MPPRSMDGMANLMIILAPLAAIRARLLLVLNVSVSRALLVPPIVLIMREFTWFPVLIIEIPTTLLLSLICIRLVTHLECPLTGN